MAGTRELGDAVADFRLFGIDGRAYDSAESRRDGLLAFVFYKRTCHTCQYAFPYLQRFHDHYTGKGFQIWGIAQENAEDTAEFARQFAATFPQLPDPDLNVTEEYAPVSVPTLYVTDASGKVLHYAPAFVRDEYNAIARLAAEQTGMTYIPVVREEDAAPAIKPG